MPSISAVGNISPVSTTTILPPYSITVMFLPISPSPPRGRTRSFELFIRLQPGALEGVPHGLALVVVGGDERQAQPFGGNQAAHPQRSLDRDRVDGEALVERPQAGVDLPHPLQVAALRRLPHLAHRLAGDVRGDQDAAGAPDL